MIHSYRHSESVQAILKGAKFAFKLSDDDYECNGHGIAYSGSKDLYQGVAGRFIIHSRMYRGYGPPKERVLPLPATVRLTDCLYYESVHQAEYSPWQDLILADDQG